MTDTATDLIWQQADDGVALIWEEALAYAENLGSVNGTQPGYTFGYGITLPLNPDLFLRICFSSWSPILRLA